MKEQRIIVWFSCGEASACALKLAIAKYGSKVIPVYCDLSKSEEADNQRFLRDVERWTGTTITLIKSSKYETIDEVFEDRKYLAGMKGAPCTVAMKKIPRFEFQLADDIHIFGFTANEGKRITEFEAKNPDMLLEWILRDNGITKKVCRIMIKSAGIEQPLRYRQGFNNNNCPCCVKASSFVYWALERRINPEIFKRRCEQSRRFGARLTRYNNKRIFLDELPPDNELRYRGKPIQLAKVTEKISCGPECGTIKW